jgi:hypothetical protein
MVTETDTFKTWAILELFGHAVLAGEVSEQVIAGQGFIRVDVPEVNGQKSYAKFYGPKAIYSITPTDEATARMAAQRLKAPPIEPWTLGLRQIAEHASEDEE